MREIAVIFDPERKLFLYFGVALMAIAVGPFGTYDAMSLWDRAIFWSLDVLGGLLIIVPVVHVFHHSRLTAFLPSLPRLVLGVALGALPAAAYITLLYRTVGAGLEISTPFPLLFVQVTLFTSILLLVEFVLWPMVFGSTKQAPTSDMLEAPAASSPVEENSLSAVPLMSRLPEGLRDAQIVSISMQDHYAEVTTTVGSTMILMRLNDAIDLLEGYPGRRVHRSHWVARDFATGLSKSGRRMEICLSDGRQLPVGATYLNKIQEWLEERDDPPRAARE